MAEDSLMTSLLQDYKRATELTVSHVFKRRKEELVAFFLDKNRKIDQDRYETRESIKLLEKSGWNEGIIKALASDQETGIIGDVKDIKRRQTFFGKNTKILPTPKPFQASVWEQCCDPMIKALALFGAILLFLGFFNAWDRYHLETQAWEDQQAALNKQPETEDSQENLTLVDTPIDAAALIPQPFLINVILQECGEALSIFVAILLITSISAVNDYNKEKQFISLLSVAKDYDVSCIRGQDGTTAPVSAYDIVVGDIITFESGDRIPADCLLLESIDLKVDEAYHNDDVKDIVEKSVVNDENKVDNLDAFLLSESLIVEGSGKAIVLVVAPPYCSRHRRDIRQDDDDAEISPLKEKLGNIGSQIGKFGLYAALILFAVFIIRGIIDLAAKEHDGLFSYDTLKTILTYMSTCLTLVMVAVPEGLPLSVSISVAYSLKSLKDKNLLIKNADSQEIMGGVEYIITGKTGTLTKADMYVTHAHIQGTTHKVEGPDFFTRQEIDGEMQELIKESILYNCTAKVEISDNARYVPTGNGTECGMLKFLQSNKLPIQDLIKKKVGNIKTFVPWTPVRKMETTAVQHPEKADIVRIYAKGAPEVLLQKCAIDEAERDNLLEEVVNNTLGKDGYRPFAYAYKEMTRDDFVNLSYGCNEFKTMEDREVLERDLELVAVFGLRDNLRDSALQPGNTVSEDIKFAKKGSITVIMVSGDNLETAKRTAIEASIVSENEAQQPNACMTGEEFRRRIGNFEEREQPDGSVKWEMDHPEEFKSITSKLRVLARAEPRDKLALVTGLQENQRTVACTGEGLNDADSLKKANVGFAMGSGCELAKDQADMIILDDNFGSAMTAVSWGRNIYENVKKFIQFQMTVNISCCAIVLISALFYNRSCFKVLHLLWINLVMDTFAALALATEPPSSNNKKSKPINNNQLIMSEIMWRQIFTQAIYQLVVMLIMLFLAPLMLGFPYYLFNPTATAPGYRGPADAITDDNKNLPVWTEVNAVEAVRHHDTIIFQTFMYLQLCNFFNCRKLGATDKNIFENFFNNPVFLIMVFGLFAAQYFLVNLPDNIVQLTNLTVGEQAVCFSFALGSFLVCLGIKFTDPALASQYIPKTLIPEVAAEPDEIQRRLTDLQKRNADEEAKWKTP